MTDLQTLTLPVLPLTTGVVLPQMVVTIALYAQQGGWRFAAVFVLMILIHEIGHGVEIKRAGLSAGYPVFIPFFGAMIAMRDQPRSPLVEARIALAGPIWGAASAVAVAALYLVTHDRFWLTLAYTGFFLNLFNLTPIGFLDGGRVARLLSRRAWIVGLAIMAAIFFFAPAPQLLLIGIMALVHALGRPPVLESEVSPAARVAVAARYFGLCAALAAGAAFSRVLLHD
jgi:Zn-dependent protease